MNTPFNSEFFILYSLFEINSQFNSLEEIHNFILTNISLWHLAIYTYFKYLSFLDG